MRIGIAMSRDRPNWPVRRLIRELESRSCEAVTFCLKDISVHMGSEMMQFLLPRRRPLDVNGLILRSIGGGSTDQITSRISVLEAMEFSGIRVFNSAYSHRRAKDKLATLVWLAHHGIPIPRTTVTERLAVAVASTKRFRDIVSKPLRGSQGQGIFRLDDPDLAFRIFKILQTANQTMLIQEFIETPGRDIRVFVVGNRAIGAMYRYAKPGAWKTNVSRGGKPEKCPLSKDLEQLAIKASKAMKMDFAGIDVLESETGLVVSEVNSAPNWSGLQKATGIDAAEEIIDYILLKLRA
ncbi:MAG: RimK family alpha-L-glutamate ligase [Candidatus Hermodarchaeota archaeon]